MIVPRRACLLILGFILLVGCATPDLPATPTVTPTATSETVSLPMVARAPLPTATPLPSPTSTPLPTVTPIPVVRFAVIGDYGANSTPEREVADLVKSWNPDFILTVGDNNYPAGAADTIDLAIGQYYHEFIYPYLGNQGAGASNNRFFPSLGNHDWMTSSAKPYLDYFTLPGNERYYDFTWGPLHFFVLDSDSREPDGVSSQSKQANWLKDGLASASEPWKIVYMHHPPYSSGMHGSITWMRWPFKEWGATAVLAGHDHTYERLQLNGILYFVNGLGGGAIYNFTDPLQGSQVRYNADYGAMLVEATPNNLTFQFFNRKGDMIDTYSLSK